MGGSSTISTSEPVLAAVRVQRSSYGVALPVVFGRCRVPINLGWYGDFRAIAHTETTRSGGKGGGGGVTQQNTTYAYEAAVVAFVAEGPIAGVRRVWQGKKQFDNLGALTLELAAGDYGQPVWNHLTTRHPDQAVGYSGIAYVRSATFALTKNAEIENHTLEVDGFLQLPGSPHCDPADVVTAILTNDNYGVGFPAARLGDTSDYSTYCRATGLLISVALTEQNSARDMLGDLLRMTNTGAVRSGGKIKLVPYGDQEVTGNGVTYTPDVTPEYDLTHDDFLGSRAHPVKVRRKSPADRYNHVQIEFINADNGFNIETVDAKDQADIDDHGLRTMPVVKMHALPSAEAASYVAETLLQRSLYICNEYEFELGWNYILLEGMDIVTLTDPGAKLDRMLVRILSVEEDPEGGLSVIAEDLPVGTATAARHPRQAAQGYTPNYNAPAGKVSTPVVFEPPVPLSDGLEVWVGVAGTANYGGCHVWISYDGNTYQQIGTVNTRARLGVLSQALPAGPAIDAASVLSVDLRASEGRLYSGSQDDARNLRTLCYVGGELLAFETATLTAESRYDLTWLVRGAYGTPRQAHAAGTPFLRVDQALFRHPFSPGDIGKTIRIKLQAFNTFGVGLQELMDLEPYSYTIRGSALNSPLPVVQNVTSNFVAGITQLHWDPVTDFRTPIDYEVRLGAAWETAKVVARTPLTTIPAVGDGHYWISAHYRAPTGVDAYSSAPAGITVTGAVLTTNVLATSDEGAAGWPGEVAGGALRTGATIRLAGAGSVLDVDDILSAPDILWLGGVAQSGTYTVPAPHQVDVGRVAPCNLILQVDGYPLSIFDNVLTVPDILAVDDLLGAALGPQIALRPQVALAGDDGIYGEWQDYVPGIYNARFFSARVLLESDDPQVTAVLSGFRFTVDVPDRVELGAVVVPAAGLRLTFDPPFNVVPNLQFSILGASPGDDVSVTNLDEGGADVQVLNGSSPVERSINWAAQAY